MLTDIEIALLLRAAGLVCQRLAHVGVVDDDGFDLGQTAQGLFEEAAKRMTAGLTEAGKRKPTVQDWINQG